MTLVSQRVVLAALAVGTIFAQDTVLLDNDQIRAVKTVHEPGKLLAHADAGRDAVIVYLPGGPAEVQWWAAQDRRALLLARRTAAPLIRIELKQPPGPATAPKRTLRPDAMIAAPDVYRLIFENERVRVMRVNSPPGHTVPTHEHALRRAVVYYTDMNARVVTPDGKAMIAQRKAGEVSWNQPATHEETNLAATPFEAVVVELK